MLTELEVNGFLVLQVPPNADPEELISRLRDISNVEVPEVSCNELRALCSQASQLFYVSSTAVATTNCAEGIAVRYNPIEDNFGVDLAQEVKTLLKRTKEGNVDVHVLPANMKVDGKKLKKTKDVNITPFGLSSGRVTPISAFWSLSSSAQNPEKLIFHFERSDFDQVGDYVTNNIASTRLSCTVFKEDYLRAIEVTIAANNRNMK